jgi:hypothetical protein
MPFEPITASPGTSAGAPWRSYVGRGPLPPESREASELLEALDDAMFTAIAGDVASTSAARELWRIAAQLLPAEIAAESREQYLRFAIETVRRARNAEVRDPALTIVALELVVFLSTEC